MKHWRHFGSAEWDHVRDGAVGLGLGSLVPVALFYASYRLWSFTAAVVIVLTWSAAVFAWHRRRRQAADVFSATTFGFACLKAAAGLASHNTFLYLAWPSLENVAYGVVLFASALAGRPILALYARRLYPIPATVQGTPAFGRAFIVVSGAWLMGHSARSAIRLWLLATLPLEAFLVLDAVAGWPISLTLVSFTVWYPLRELRRAGLIDPPATIAAAASAAEEATDEPSPGLA